jgi:hypothetical protein
MFSEESFTSGWLQRQAKTLGGCNQDILERSLYALTLLGHLADSGLPFVFKGGTSLLLHLPQARRLSIDVDIVCGEKAEVVNDIVAGIGQKAPFLRCEENDRRHRDLPRRRHFKFFYRSALGSQVEMPILLDVVEEGRIHHTLTQRAIQTSFLKPEREIMVKLPTLESLLADKLTAFAPSVGMAESHRFAHNHGKELQFHDGGIPPDRLAGLFLVICPPFDVFKGIAISDCARGMVMLFLQPECQPFPTAGIAFQGEGAFAVPFEVLRHPSIPPAAADFTGSPVQFFGFKLRTQGAGFDGFAGIVCPEAGGLVPPRAVCVNELDEPEGRILFSVNGCHKPSAVCAVMILHKI